MRLEELIIYQTLAKDQVVRNMFFYQETGDEEALQEAVRDIVKIACQYGFYGDIWHCYLTYLLVMDENPYSRYCELREEVGVGSIHKAVLFDLNKIRELYAISDDFVKDQHPFIDLLQTFEPVEDVEMAQVGIGVRISKLAKKLSDVKDEIEFKDRITKFYQQYGVGALGLYKAFRIGKENILQPVKEIEQVYLNDLVGYELPKQKLIDNTEAFLAGKPANNCLLFGDAGTGKSSSVKAILHEYYDKGLRMIEVYKHQFQSFHDVLSQVRDRNYKFVLYMDDLSFEDFESEYKYLKAMMEGGLERKPSNVLIYATSNRRHLIRESFSDKEGRRDTLHASDTVQEKLSLVARFGVSIFYCAPDKKEFQNIVRILAQKHSLVMEEEALLLEANKWELTHGGLSGRTAQQFINYLLGKQ